MALYDTESIVVNTIDLGEADLLVTLFTREYGKIKAVARGARILKSRYSGFFQPLLVLNTLYFGNERQELYRMASIDPVKVYDISSSMDKMFTAFCMMEVLEHCCGPGEINLPMYRLALEGIELLDSGDQGPNLALCFAMRGLSVAGYMPHLKDCIACGGDLSGDKLRFSPSRGGVLCNRCLSGAGEHFPISMGCLKFLVATLGLDLKRSSRIKLNQNLKEETGNIIFNHIAYNLGREMKSLRFLEL